MAFPEAMAEEPPDEDTERPSLLAFPGFPAALWVEEEVVVVVVVVEEEEEVVVVFVEEVEEVIVVDCSSSIYY